MGRFDGKGRSGEVTKNKSAFLCPEFLRNGVAVSHSQILKCQSARSLIAEATSEHDRLLDPMWIWSLNELIITLHCFLSFTLI